jgi:hypothetical protein
MQPSYNRNDRGKREWVFNCSFYWFATVPRERALFEGHKSSLTGRRHASHPSIVQFYSFIVYLPTVSILWITQCCIIGRLVNNIKRDVEGNCRGIRNLWYYPGICLERLRNTMKSFSRTAGLQAPGTYLEPRLPKYKTGVVLSTLQSSFITDLLFSYWLICCFETMVIWNNSVWISFDKRSSKVHVYINLSKQTFVTGRFSLLRAWIKERHKRKSSSEALIFLRQELLVFFSIPVSPYSAEHWTRRFGNRISFRPQMKCWEIPTLLDPLERSNPNSATGNRGRKEIQFPKRRVS